MDTVFDQNNMLTIFKNKFTIFKRRMYHHRMQKSTHFSLGIMLENEDINAGKMLITMK